MNYHILFKNVSKDACFTKKEEEWIERIVTMMMTLRQQYIINKRKE